MRQYIWHVLADNKSYSDMLQRCTSVSPIKLKSRKGHYIIDNASTRVVTSTCTCFQNFISTNYLGSCIANGIIVRNVFFAEVVMSSVIG
jgi:hypothetical protein